MYSECQKTDFHQKLILILKANLIGKTFSLPPQAKFGEAIPEDVRISSHSLLLDLLRTEAAEGAQDRDAWRCLIEAMGSRPR